METNKNLEITNIIKKIERFQSCQNNLNHSCNECSLKNDMIDCCDIYEKSVKNLVEHIKIQINLI